MVPRKLRVMLSTFSYGGNGGFASTHPAISEWMVRTTMAASKDERIEGFYHADFVDTPITMTRNLAVQTAKESGADVLVMCDSDQHPDLYLSQFSDAKPFFKSSFDFLYDHYEKGPVVIGSPYCGPPVEVENVYVFQWLNRITGNADDDYKLEAYTREQASMMAGIQECGALPTGLIMYDMRAFDLVAHPYFYYEYVGDGDECEHCGCRKPGPQSQKGSTEDVTATRDISLGGILQLGYNPVFCNWDAWAGHYKPKCVGKPIIVKADNVAKKMRDRVLQGHHTRDVIAPVDFTKNDPPVLPVNRLAALNGNGRHKKNGAPPDKPIVTVEKLPDGTELPFGLFTPPDDLADLTMLVGIVAKENDRPLRILEVGSWVGQSALALHAGFGPKGGTIYCVDTWEGTPGDATGELAKAHPGFNPYEYFHRNTAKIRSSLEIHKGPSLEIAKAFADGEYPIEPFDLIFLDGDHSYEAVKADIEAWLPHVRQSPSEGVPGGILCGHDYAVTRYPGVAQAVRELFPKVEKFKNSVWGVRVWQLQPTPA